MRALPSDAKKPDPARLAVVEAERALRSLSPPERHLACLCALLAGARAEELAEGLPVARFAAVTGAMRAFSALDRTRRLRIFASVLAEEPEPIAERSAAPPPRLAAVLALGMSNREREAWLAKHGATALAEDARAAHPALKAYAVRCRTAR